MKKTALILMIITIISKIFGFLGEIGLSYFYGASIISDAYLVSLTIPGIVFSLIGMGISTGYIPIYTGIIRERSRDYGDRFTNNLINFLMIFCLILTIITLIFTKEIVMMVASGFTGQTLELTILFTRITILSLGFSGLIYIFNGYLQVNGDFISPAIVVIAQNIIILLSIIISGKTNIIFLAIGNTLGIIVQFLLLIPSIYRKGYSYYPLIDIRDKYLIQIIHISIPIIIGTSVNQMNRLIDRAFASNIIIGGVSAINYGFKLETFIHDIFVMTLATISYPIISKMASEKNIKGLKDNIIKTMIGVNLFLIPTWIGSLILAKPIITLLFGRGAFDYNAINMTSTALFFYSIAMVAHGLREILLRGFYSLQKTKATFINALIAIGLNIILNALFYKPFGIGGIALATSISIIVSSLFLFINTRKAIGYFRWKDLIYPSIKILIASSVMGLTTKLIYNLLEGRLGGNLTTLISITLGAIIYFIVIIPMGINEVNGIIKALKKKLLNLR